MELSSIEKEIIIERRRKQLASDLKSSCVLEVAQVMSGFSDYLNREQLESFTVAFTYSDFNNWWHTLDGDLYRNLKQSKIPLKGLFDVVSKMDTLAEKYGEVIADDLAESIPAASFASSEYINA
jgi:hypothetical protein